PRAGLARVASDHEAMPFRLPAAGSRLPDVERAHQRGANPRHRLVDERRLPGLAANAVSTEKLHGLLGAMVTVTTAVCGERSRQVESGTPMFTTSRTVRVWSVTDTGSVIAATSRFNAFSGLDTSTVSGSLFTLVIS